MLAACMLWLSDRLFRLNPCGSSFIIVQKVSGKGPIIRFLSGEGGGVDWWDLEQCKLKIVRAPISNFV